MNQEFMSDVLEKPVLYASIPCRNERRHIETCVRSILGRSGLYGGIDVVMVDGLSGDGTGESLGNHSK